MSVALETHALDVAIGANVLCRALTCTVRAGQCWAIVGPNGAGKSTLLRTLAGILPPRAGDVVYGGASLRALSPRAQARKRGWLPQADHDAFPARVLDAVVAGRHPWASRWGWEGSDDLALAHEAIRTMGLGGLESRDVRTLSGGERRRVAIAALLAQDPEVLLLDEPSSHLDLKHQVEAFDVLTALARRSGKAIVVVLHDLHLALRYADHAIAIARGTALAGPAGQILAADALSALFEHPLVAVGDDRVRTLLPR